MSRERFVRRADHRAILNAPMAEEIPQSRERAHGVPRVPDMVRTTIYLPEDLLDELEARNLAVADIVLDALRAELGRLATPGSAAARRSDPPDAATGGETRRRSCTRGVACDGPWRSGVDSVQSETGPVCRTCADVDRQLEGLTQAELRVLGFLNTHLSLAEIGHRLSISRATVKSHVASLHQKLGVRTRAEIVAVLGIPSRPIMISDRLPSALAEARSA
jgi:DNA-binding CsgD family transcriptional regulator